ncbi:MAG: helix-turn-helix domain-containing protein [Oscillospiraceae bacterium]|nr:helix-turn-helix domain-containing protein [Oscillospiraceae bacterium]
MTKIGENIRKHRKMLNLKQEDVAKHVGKSRNVVANWEAGINSPDVNTVEQLCELFKISPNDLFGWLDGGDGRPVSFVKAQENLNENETLLLKNYRIAEEVIKEAAFKMLEDSAQRNAAAKPKVSVKKTG